ncbi:hypothetical protein [Turneriella parva]|uniref:IPT/TIG domain-containing protein n=1 Tax=Turneriella parva (strain ATCC BAA-1111 / DSM 21527 / NCTC 11395 / H) TaxID=869212 RepID=I4B383_TURPD|nr:hypothetical protein [Turneriella parva]AFM11740.1 hypothetical protein Turpa_1091 [Turneriella parva DSM 21527]
MKITHLICGLAFLTTLFLGCAKSRDGSATTETATQVAPGISLNPATGPTGTLLTITSTGFDLASLSGVTINGTAAIILTKELNMARVMVMPGSTSGPLIATTTVGTQSASFTVAQVAPIARQQGAKLVGGATSSETRFGYSAALSADGNTAIIGGYGDNGSQGAAWVYTRSGTNWEQQGEKLVGTGNVGNASQGSSVALSADGNTAIVGGKHDNGAHGAAWIFIRRGATWQQQGEKLVGTGGHSPQQGDGVALSADGNTAIVGGPGDNQSQGAAWVFVRNGSTWSQQGEKLVGTGNMGAAFQGRSVALSANGNTAIVGGYFDNLRQGAAWIFFRNGSTWSQQGEKLVGLGNVGVAQQGYSVAISADGDTVIVGGRTDDNDRGAAWIFVRNGTTWSQQGNKIVGTTSEPWASQGHSVALSADGDTAILGGYSDNSDQGAIWVFKRTATTWSQIGNKLVGTGSSESTREGQCVALSADATTAISGGDMNNSGIGAAWVWVP